MCKSFGECCAHVRMCACAHQFYTPVAPPYSRGRLRPSRSKISTILRSTLDSKVVCEIVRQANFRTRLSP